MNEQIVWIQALRGFLCLWVVLFHYTTRYGQIYDSTPFISFDNGGSVGVASFFLLSGFLCKKTIYKYYNNTEGWLIKKYFRLWPSYVICTVVSFIFIIVLGLPGRDNITFGDLLKDLLMIPYISGNIEHASWYVMSLVKFYFFIYIIARFKILDSEYLYILIFMLFVISLIYPDLLLSKFTRSILGYLPLYAGMVLFNYISTRKKSFLILYTLMVCYLSYTIHLVYIPIIGIFLLLSFMNNKIVSNVKTILSNKILVCIGTFSYTWYLIHQNVGYIIILQSKVIFNHSFYSILFAMILTFGLAVILDIISQTLFSIINTNIPHRFINNDK